MQKKKQWAKEWMVEVDVSRTATFLLSYCMMCCRLNQGALVSFWPDSSGDRRGPPVTWAKVILSLAQNMLSSKGASAYQLLMAFLD
jgi:hypothetical protein